MNANELRIGNYVIVENTLRPENLKYHEVTEVSRLSCQVTCNDNKFEDYYGQKYEFIKPIPLTESWLCQFGLKKSGNHYLFKTNTDSGACLSNDFKLIFSDFERCKIEHVHQLQNLYFALTNEELTN